MEAALQNSRASPSAGSNHGPAHMEVGEAEEFRGERDQSGLGQQGNQVTLSPRRSIKFRLAERRGK